MSVDFLLGPRYQLDGTPIAIPAGQLIPRPFDIRHINRGVVGRGQGGSLYRNTYPNFDLVYETTGNALAKALRACYNPTDSRVWIQILDHIINTERWYSATMLEPHIERTSGTVVAGILLSFRRVVPYVEP